MPVSSTSGSTCIAGAIAAAAQDQARCCEQSDDAWLGPLGLRMTASPATAARFHPNILIHAEPVPSVPTTLLRRWATGQHDCVVIDITGRYAQIGTPAATGSYVDVADVSADPLRAVARPPRSVRSGVSVLDFSRVPTASSSAALGRDTVGPDSSSGADR
jgi:hypothetical protein